MRVVDLGQELANPLEDVKCLSTEFIAGKDLLDIVHMALALHKSASRQRFLVHTKHREMLLADKAVVESQFCKFRETGKSKLTEFRGLLTASWHEIQPLIVSGSGYLSPKKVLNDNCS